MTDPNLANSVRARLKLHEEWAEIYARLLAILSDPSIASRHPTKSPTELAAEIDQLHERAMRGEIRAF